MDRDEKSDLDLLQIVPQTTLSSEIRGHNCMPCAYLWGSPLRSGTCVSSSCEALGHQTEATVSSQEVVREQGHLAIWSLESLFHPWGHAI